MAASSSAKQKTIDLPQPSHTGSVPVESALQTRRSVRDFSGEALTLEEASQLLWAAQGTTSSSGGRTAPSAGALYPLEVYLVAGNITALPAGIYHYVTAGHRLELVASGDKRSEIGRAAVGQDWLAEAPAMIIIAAVAERTREKYGSRADRYVSIEAGCAAQNVALQAVALQLGTVDVGAFYDRRIREFAGIKLGEEPLIVMPVGHPKTK